MKSLFRFPFFREIDIEVQLDTLKQRIESLDTKMKKSKKLFFWIRFIHTVLLSIAFALTLSSFYGFSKSRDVQTVYLLRNYAIFLVAVFLSRWLFSKILTRAYLYFDRQKVNEEKVFKETLISALKNEKVEKVHKYVEKFDPTGVLVEETFSKSPLKKVLKIASEEENIVMNISANQKSQKGPSTGTTERLTSNSASFRKSFSDKLVDYFLGDGPEHRFALICKHCHTHNGMVPPQHFSRSEYFCYQCKGWNSNRREPNTDDTLSQSSSTSSIPPNESSDVLPKSQTEDYNVQKSTADDDDDEMSVAASQPPIS